MAHVDPIAGYACDCIPMMFSIYEECSFFIFTPASVGVEDNGLGLGVSPMLVFEMLVLVFSMFVNSCLTRSKVKLDHIKISLMLNSTKKQAS